MSLSTADHFLSAPGSALPPPLFKCASNHFLSSTLLLLVSTSPLFPPNLSPYFVSLESLATPPHCFGLSHSFSLTPLSECASDGPFLSNPVHIDPYGSSMQGEGCENHCYSVLNATNALDVGPETRLPGRALSIAAPSCQQQPNGLSIWDL